MITPALIKNDPWLKPYEAAVIGRLQHAQDRERELTKSSNNSLLEFANGHIFFGMHRTEQHWVFREWAPNASEIYLVGTFSDWQVREDFALTRRSGYWEIQVPLHKINHTDLYKLFIRWPGGEGERIPSYARRAVQDETTKIFCAQVWSPEKQYQWQVPNYARRKEAPLIYEAHVGMATEEYKTGTYNEFRQIVLPRVKKAGYNTIQLMAIQEHPYYGSFGYHVSNFFGVSSRFGTPEELKALIDEAHKMDIAVIMDLVHSHAVRNELEGLARFDGTDYQYFHQGAKGNHEAWDSKCFDYGKNEVVHFLLSNCKYWLDEYKFDGFRFDGVTSMLYMHHGLECDFTGYDNYFDGSQDGDAITYLILANKLIHEVKPSAITIAEEVSGMPGLASPLEYGGYGFDFRLSMGIPDFWIKTMKEKRDEDWNVGHIFHELTQGRNDESTISYAESHDQALVGDKTIAFWLMDKEMYFNMHVAYPSIVIDRGMALHKMIRLMTLSTARHGYLTFMGNEFGHPEWIDFPRQGNNWSYQHARRQWSLAENEELRYKFLGRFDRDMIELIRNTPYFFENGANFIAENVADQVIVYERANLIFVMNFNPTQSFPDYGIEVPKGTYRIVLNSDSGLYGGPLRVDDKIDYHTSQQGVEYYAPHQLKIYIPSQCVLVFKKIS